MTSHFLNCSLIKVQSTFNMHHKEIAKEKKGEMQDGVS